MKATISKKPKTSLRRRPHFPPACTEVNGMVQRGDDVVIVDVRLPSDFRQGHIPGALNLLNGQWYKATGLSRKRTLMVVHYHWSAPVDMEKGVARPQVIALCP